MTVQYTKSKFLYKWLHLKSWSLTWHNCKLFASQREIETSSIIIFSQHHMSFLWPFWVLKQNSRLLNSLINNIKLRKFPLVSLYASIVLVISHWFYSNFIFRITISLNWKFLFCPLRFSQSWRVAGAPFPHLL